MEKIRIVVRLADTDAHRALLELEKMFKEKGGFIMLFESIDHDKKKIDKFLYSCFYQQALLYQRLGHHETAFDMLSTCMKLMADHNPKSIWYAMGISLYHLQRYNEAGPYFLHYKKSNPPDNEKVEVQRFMDTCLVQVQNGS